MTISAPWPRRTQRLKSSLVLAAMAVAPLLSSTIDAAANANPDIAPPAQPLCDEYAPATVIINGGEITNSTVVDLSADGGAAIGDSSGGDENLAVTGEDDEVRKRRDNDRKNRHDREEDSGDVAAAGNGGASDASANGGAIAVENVNSGGNVGSAIAVGDTYGGYGCSSGSGNYGVGNSTLTTGGVFIDGGAVSNETVISVSADGGTAIADASGGDNNVAVNGGSAGNGGVMTSSAGNGGVSTASADGGAVSIGDINSGGNAGNANAVGDTYASPIIVPSVPGVVPVPRPGPNKPVPIVVPDAPRPGKVVIVTRLPSTGIAPPHSSLASITSLLALLTGLTSLAARRRYT